MMATVGSEAPAKYCPISQCFAASTDLVGCICIYLYLTQQTKTWQADLLHCIVWQQAQHHTEVELYKVIGDENASVA